MEGCSQRCGACALPHGR